MKSTEEELISELPKCRSREGAWIEISMDLVNELYGDVAPARERGLKCIEKAIRNAGIESLPRGSVD